MSSKRLTLVMRVWTLDVTKFRDVKLQINSSRTYMSSLDKFKDADVFHSAILPIFWTFLCSHLATL